MIIDKNDGTVANVRITTEEAEALKLAIKHSHLVVRQIKELCPNNSVENLSHDLDLENLSHDVDKIIQGEVSFFR